MTTEHLKKTGASAILLAMLLPWLSWLTLTTLSNSSEHAERINRVESRSEYNQDMLIRIERGVEKLNDKIDKLREVK